MPRCLCRRRTKPCGGRNARADEHDAEEVQHLAYLASQRVEIAKTAAEQHVAEAQIQQTTEERDRVLLDARTREAQRAQQEAARATQQAQAATTQAQQLQQGNWPPSRLSRRTGAWYSPWATSCLRRAVQTSALVRCAIIHW